jgi:hypothetical protein
MEMHHCSREIGRMLWFFERSGERLVCEVRLAADGPGYELVVSWPTGRQTVETFKDMPALLRREHELDRAWRAQGWIPR